MAEGGVPVGAAAGSGSPLEGSDAMSGCGCDLTGVPASIGWGLAPLAVLLAFGGFLRRRRL